MAQMGDWTDPGAARSTDVNLACMDGMSEVDRPVSRG